MYLLFGTKLLIVAVAVLLLPACTQVEATAETINPVSETPLPRVSENHSQLSNLLNVKLEMPSEVGSLEGVPIKLTVKNASSDLITVWLGVAPQDFVVAGGDGAEVWRWSHGKVFTANLGSITLRTGEMKEYLAYWPQRTNCMPVTYAGTCLGDLVTPGRYLVRGSFRAALTSRFDAETITTDWQELVIAD